MREIIGYDKEKDRPIWSEVLTFFDKEGETQFLVGDVNDYCSRCKWWNDEDRCPYGSTNTDLRSIMT